MANRMLVIGLDGATFDVINPLMEQGWMPNVKKLIQEGASGRLQSTMPPVTGPAWLAMATGLTPGKTGIYDFIKRKGEDGYKFTFINSSEYKGRAIWDFLSSSGKRVGIVNYPNLYPTYKVNGFIVSGGIGSPKLSNFTYPGELETEIEHFLGYNREVNLKDTKYENLDLFIEDLNDIFRRRVECTKYLVQKKEWDFLWAVFSETDWIQHMMWKFIETKKYGEEFKKFWGRVDTAIGELKNIAGDEVNLIIVSDHGFGPCYNQSFRLNAWLKSEGYFKPKRQASRIFWSGKKLRRGLKRIAEFLQITRRFPALVDWGKRATTSLAILINAVDLENSVAFDPGHIGSFGGIYINDYLITDSNMRQRIRDDIKQKLYKFGKEKGLDMEIYTPEELYGNKPKSSLDLIIRVNEGGYTVEKWGFDEKFLDKLPARISFLNGTHRMDGVFIGSGPDFIRSEVKNARLWDIPSTVLYCFNEAIPSSMEGRVLMEAMKTKEHPKYKKEKTEISEEKYLTREEEKEISKQLSDLGYF